MTLETMAKLLKNITKRTQPCLDFEVLLLF